MTADAFVRSAAIRFDSLAVAGRFAAAIAVAEGAHRARPTVPVLAEVVIPRYARRALTQGDTASAVAIARLALTIYPMSPASYREAARMELTARDSASARTHLAEALRLAPNHAWARSTAATLRVK